jgi:8-oxo-dGTP diphosphatase
MSVPSAWRYRVLRRLGRSVTRIAAALTLGEMPSFVSTSAIVVDGQSLLVVVDAIRNEAVLPGGHLKWDEDPQEAVIREVREETGYTIEPGDLIGVFAGKERAGERGIVRLVYEASVVGGALTSSGEGEARWLPLAEVAASETRDAWLVQMWKDHQRRAALP